MFQFNLWLNETQFFFVKAIFVKHKCLFDAIILEKTPYKNQGPKTL